MAKQLYKSCKTLRLPPFLFDQLMRASSSVVLNIAEGSGKQTTKDQKRFYAIALGSLRECEAIMDMEDIGGKELRDLANQLTVILFTLCRKTET